MTDSPLRLLQMPTRYGMGGIARHVLGLTAWLRDRGHHVTLSGTPSTWASAETEPGFVALHLDQITEEGGALPRRLFFVARYAAALRLWLMRHKVDLIHCHESAPALVSWLATRGTKVPVAVTYHGAEPGRVAQFGKIARRCDLVITPSHRSAEDLATIGGVPRDKLKVIGLGLKPAPPEDSAAVAALRADLIGDADRLVVTIARITRQKGIDVLIDCVAEVLKTRPATRFVLVGYGPDEDAMKVLARDKGVGEALIFAGRTETPHLYLRAADLFLLTSRWEALPFTIAEAFQAGTPAIATACSGVVELIDNAVGRVVPIGDVPEIAQTVVDVLEDDASRHAMASAALERSREDRFDPDWIHQQFETTYRELSGAR